MRRPPMGCTRPPTCNGNTNTSRDICVGGEDVMVRADLNIIEWFTVNISGKITNQCNRPARDVVLRLLQVSGDRTREIAQTRTDDNGCYCFSFRTTDCHACYRVVAPMSGRDQDDDEECRHHHHHHHHHGGQDDDQGSEDCDC